MAHRRKSKGRPSRESGEPPPQPSAKEFPSSVFDSFLQSRSFTRQEFRAEESVRSAEYWDVNEEFDLKVSPR